jgi:thiamine-monophosphate kinase
VSTVEPTLGDIGEFGLIRRMAAIVASRNGWGVEETGPGDDAAVVSLGGDPRVVATTDMLVEGRHFRTDWSSANDIGRKAAAQNLADLEAMGARPVTMLVAFGAPASTRVAFAEELFRGLVEEAGRGGATVAGGDTVAAEQLTVSVSALGSLDGRDPVTRSGARAGDQVYGVGRLGCSAAGLELLRRSDPILIERHAQLVDLHRVPAPPYGAGARLASAGVTAMIDVSDGLLADLLHVARASHVDVDLDFSSWRDDELTAAADDLGASVDDWLLRGGEDHALVCTAPAHVSIRVLSEAAGTGVRRIGSMVPPGSPHASGLADAPAKTRSVGFDHFADTP